MNDDQIQGQLADLRSQVTALNDRLRQLEDKMGNSQASLLSKAPHSRAEEMRYENASEIYELGHS